VRLDLGYDGTEFHGWAAQPGLRTVEGTLGQALAKIIRRPVGLTVAGRTDAGVHARGQVAHLDLTEAELGRLTGLEALARRLNAVLPDDVRVWAASAPGAEFDARFSALWREYRYRIADQRAACDPLERAFTWWTAPLDAAAIAQAGRALVGEHDFTAFCVPRPGASNVREVLKLRVERVGPGRLEIWARADAFCHRMVRFTVGALVAVGRGRRPVRWVGEVLAARRRDSAVEAAPARGLTLERVAYPTNPADLAVRAAQTRSRRA
jgi:tRNA pseudouridine38-40 synthase